MSRTKKLYTFVPENEELIKRIVSDVMEEKSINESLAIEKILIRCFYGESKSSYFFIKSIYDIGINSVLRKIYSNNAAGINGNCINSDFLNFVKFSIAYISENNLDVEIDKNDSLWSYFKTKYQALLINSKIDGYDLDSFYYVSDIICFILNKWDELNGYDLTYRLLSVCHAIIRAQNENIIDTPYQRLKLRELILDSFADSKSNLHIL